MQRSGVALAINRPSLSEGIRQRAGNYAEFGIGHADGMAHLNVFLMFLCRFRCCPQNLREWIDRRTFPDEKNLPS
jgi:hypothetical protein